jgi:hypothetical protein
VDALEAGLIVLVAFVLIVLLLVRIARMPRLLSLQEGFQALGTLKGRTAEEIIEAVGPPNSRSAYRDSRSLLQWLEPGYHISLGFDADGVCTGVSHESSSRGL